jgi:hypothetical protein
MDAERASVGQFVTERLKEVRPDDPQRRQRVFRAFLEGSLLDIFGTEALGDPAFHSTLDQVQLSMESDPDLARAMHRTVDTLLNVLAAGTPSSAHLKKVFGSDSS